MKNDSTNLTQDLFNLNKGENHMPNYKWILISTILMLAGLIVILAVPTAYEGPLLLYINEQHAIPADGHHRFSSICAELAVSQHSLAPTVSQERLKEIHLQPHQILQKNRPYPWRG